MNNSSLKPIDKVIATKNAPAAIGPYSQAVVHNGCVYISGQIGIDPQTGELCAADFESQAKQVLSNLEGIARAAGSSLNYAIKLTAYLTDLRSFQVLNELMAESLVEPYPARACVEVSALPKVALLEVDAILALPETEQL